VWSFEHSAGAPPHPIAESAGIQPGVRDDVVVLPFNDASALEDALSAEPHRFAAVILEPFQRAIPPVPGFLERVREACSRAGTVLIFDEIVTGFRFAPGGAQERYGVVPDLTALGKALAGGVPLAALAGRRELMEHLDQTRPGADLSFQCGTFNGNLLGVECAHTALDVMVDEGGISALRRITGAAADALRAAFADEGVPVTVTAEGGVFQPYFTAGPVVNADDVRASDTAMAAAYHARLLDAGVYKLPAKGYLSIVHDDAAVGELADATRWALRSIREA
jgi:glutamate-1-semialdehyde 2,1-aminomutase